MNKLTIIILNVCLLICSSCAITEEKLIEDNLLLSLVLQRSYEDGGYTVVAPQTSLSHLDINNPKEVKQYKNYINEKIKIEECDVRKLVDLLFERNKVSVRLSLKSSPKDGYLLDYDGKYKKYFEKNGGGWEKWYKENPMAHGQTRVSLPAYDIKTNVFLVYIGTQSEWLSGGGGIFAYKYEDGNLKELASVPLWTS